LPQGFALRNDDRGGVGAPRDDKRGEAISGQRSAGRGQRSAVSDQQSAVGGRGFLTYISRVCMIEPYHACILEWGLNMAKTTVVIDDDLLDEALKASGAKTKKEVIAAGLRELVRRGNLEALRRELGTFDLALSPEELERLRDER